MYLDCNLRIEREALIIPDITMLPVATRSTLPMSSSNCLLWLFESYSSSLGKPQKNKKFIGFYLSLLLIRSISYKSRLYNLN